jgi:hypothetical protein
MRDDSDNTHIILKLPRQRISQAPPQSPAPVPAPAKQGAAAIVDEAFRQALSWRLSTFFTNSITGAAKAEEDFRNGLPELIEARDRALTILTNTRGI